MGPVFNDSQSIAANSAVDVIQSPSSGSPWIYRRLPWPAMLAYAMDATATGLVLTVTIGSDMQVGPEFPIAAGGTAGVFPIQEGQFQALVGAAGDLLSFLVRNTTGGAVTANTVIRLTPAV